MRTLRVTSLALRLAVPGIGLLGACAAPSPAPLEDAPVPASGAVEAVQAAEPQTADPPAADPQAANPTETPGILVGAPESVTAWSFLRHRYDGNGDGRITRAEYTRSDRGYLNLDANRDGVLDSTDFDPRWDAVARKKDFVYGVGGPGVGETAPTFSLPLTTGGEFDLSAWRGKKAVALVFGSFT